MDIMTRPIYEYQVQQQKASQDTIREALNSQKIRELRLFRLQKQAAQTKDPAERRSCEIATREVHFWMYQCSTFNIYRQIWEYKTS
jgi:hypothetical protein